MRSDRTLRAYLWLVVVIAAPVIVMAAIAAVRGFDARPRGTVAVIVVVFCLVLIAGELWPIPVARGKGAGDDLTVSSTFGFGLLFIAPVFIAMIAQAVALTAMKTGAMKSRPNPNVLDTVRSSPAPLPRRSSSR